MNPNIPTKNNNPGDLKDPTTGQFHQFSSPQEGYAALLNDLQSKISGTSTTGIGPSSTLADFSKVYAPASDQNDPAQYTANLANKLGVRPDATLGSLQGRIGEFADAIAGNEGFQGAKSSSGGYDVTPAFSKPTGQPAAPSTASPNQSLGDELKGRLSDAGNALTGAASGKINWLSGVIQALGAGAGGIGDIVNKGLELIPGVKQAEGALGAGVGKLAETGVGQAVLKQVDSFKQAHPELSDDIGAGFNIATAIPIFRGLGTVADVALSGAGKALAGIAEKGALTDLTDALSRTKTLSKSFAQNGGQATLKEGITQRILPDIADGKYATQEAYKTAGTAISDIEDNELQPALAKANTGAIATQQSLDTMINDAGNFARTQFKPTGSVIDKVKNLLGDYKASYGDYPTLQDITDIKRDIRNGVNFNSPKLDQNAAYILGQYLQKNVEDAATKLGLGDVHAINAKMGNLIKYQNMLQSLDGTPVKLGRIGRVLKAAGGDAGMVIGETAGNAIGLPFAGTLGGRALGGSLSKAGGGLVRSARNAVLKRTGEGAIVPALSKVASRAGGLVGASLLQKATK